MYKLLVFLAILSFAFGISYEGHKAYKVFAKNGMDNAVLLTLKNNKSFNFWSRPNKIGSPVVIMVAPDAEASFLKLLSKNEISYKIFNEDVQSTIEKEREFHASRPKLNKKAKITFDQYYRHDEINAYLEQLAEDYPDIVEIETIGQSLEKRNLTVIKISAAETGTNPAIFVEAGIHAREWITPANALYIINQLVENPDNADLIKNVEWIVLPSLNPDGYEYTWTDDRYWRKTRRPGLLCDGVDANRNYDFHWLEGGSSTFECAEDYAGPEANSEVEIQAETAFLSKTKNIKLYVGTHSNAQVMIYPWSYTAEPTENAEELDALFSQAADAIKAVKGTEYEVGDTYTVMYPASGSSHDWAKGVSNISLAGTIELPGPFWGFDPPTSEILGIVSETFEAFKVFQQNIVKKFAN